jgi:hypothetical protein
MNGKKTGIPLLRTLFAAFSGCAKAGQTAPAGTAALPVTPKGTTRA